LVGLWIRFGFGALKNAQHQREILLQYLFNIREFLFSQVGTGFAAMLSFILAVGRSYQRGRELPLAASLFHCFRREICLYSVFMF